MGEERKQELLSREELTIAEAAELWGASIQSVWRYVKLNLLEGRDVAPKGMQRSQWRVSTASLKERMGIADKSPSELINE